MIYHAMFIIKAATENLYLGQILVITVDQPPYVITKAIQWNPITEFNKDNYFVLLYPLHSEMFLEKLLGDWQRDSSWTEILIDALVTPPGRTEVMLKGSHVMRTHYAHQVTAFYHFHS